ncbi:MAG: bifunctional non-ous end joining protein LigD [Thermoplasmata archaeon]|jgi:bifunctional non-homologous end joining protein LigD|nr:bifunctional non-ous end joining protein LigD [Thermoplasmata archaeon]
METVESVALAFREGTSDKVYHAQLRREGAAWSVWFEYGRRGAHLTQGYKVEATDEATARKKYESLVAEKTGKGYRAEADASAAEPSPAPPPVLTVGPPAQLPSTGFGVGVMLAEPGAWTDVRADLARLSGGSRYVAETKLDGMRIIATIKQNHVTSLLSREGEEETHRFPEVVSTLEELELGDVMLDGELGSLDASGLRMDVNVLQKRPRTDRLRIRAHVARNPMTFVAFDLLQEGNHDLRPLIYAARRARLEILARRGLHVAKATNAMLALYDEVLAAKGEGVIVKDTTAPYVGKRSNAWRKAKEPARVDNLVVVGLLEGTGKRVQSFGAFILAREAEGGLEYVCCAGSGLRDADLVRVMDATPAYQVRECPLARRPVLSKPVLMWLRPALKADIRYERTVKEAPRFPRVHKVVIPTEG